MFDPRIFLYLDCETRSPVDIKKAGLENYARACEVLMLAWAVNDSDVRLWLPVPREREETVPYDLTMYLRRPEVIKVAWNAAFERAVLKYALGIDIPVEQWLDPSTMSRYAGAPGSLAGASEAFRLNGEAKDKEGVRLIRMFCTPGKRGHKTPAEAPEDWQKFQEYCRQDVVAERALLKRLLPAFSLPERERKILALDQKINERGIPVDLQFVRNAKALAERERARLVSELRELTRLDNPNSGKQLLAWLRERGYPYASLGKKWVELAVRLTGDGQGSAQPAVDVTGREGPESQAHSFTPVLELRQQLAKSSTKKLDTILARVSPDGWLRRNYKYYGAHTGRWSGEGVQLQNLPRGVLSADAFDEGVVLIQAGGDLSGVGPVLDVVSSCLRGSFRAPEGKKFVVADLAQIEVRVLAWLAGCTSLLQVFERGEDVYVAFARDHLYRGQEITKHKRQIAKSAVLGCGYQLSGGEEQEDKNGDTIKTGLWGYAAAMGIEMTQEEAHAAVAAFRTAYPEVTALWRNLQNAAIRAVVDKCRVDVGPVAFVGKPSLLCALLPSGRRLHYPRPEVEKVSDGWPKLSYEGLTMAKKWRRKATYGGHLTENLVQAIARDVLAEGMLRADEAGLRIVGHTHDEIICLWHPPLFDLASRAGHRGALEVLKDCMTQPMPWAPDLQLAADGYESVIYRK